MVLIHGLGGSWQTWLENIPALAMRHRVIAVDLPGFGGSESLPEPAEMSAHADVLASLFAQLDIEAPTVVAHSMGGLVAAQLAATRPHLVGRLVLANAGGVPIGRLRLQLITRGFRFVNIVAGRPDILRAVARSEPLRTAALSTMVADPRRVSPELAAEIFPMISAPGFLGAVRAASGEVGKIDLADLQCPVLLVWGDKDPILPMRLANELTTNIPHARLTVIRNVGHCPMFEAPHAFNRAVLDFAAEPA